MLLVGRAVAYVDNPNQVFGGPWGDSPRYQWVENDPPTTEELMVGIRAQRNQLLVESDFTQLPDVPLTTE